jgi:homocysteine S-methyltransferase
MKAAGEAGARRGIQIAIELIENLKAKVQGIYLMPAFSRYDYAAEIIESIHS